MINGRQKRKQTRKFHSLLFCYRAKIEFCTAKRVTLPLVLLRQKKFAAAATLSMQKKIRLDEFENRFAPAAALSGQKKIRQT